MANQGLDHEEESSYEIIVTATDDDDNVAEIMVTITVTNVNEPPVFPETTGSPIPMPFVYEKTSSCRQNGLRSGWAVDRLWMKTLVIH